MKLQGSIVALITPFYEDGTVNFERLGEILDWYIAQGTDGILVLGTTGESSTMSHEEDDAVCRFTIGRVAGRVPVIAGSGSNSTETQLEKSKKYAAMEPMPFCALLPTTSRPMPKACTVTLPMCRRGRCTGDFV